MKIVFKNMEKSDFAEAAVKERLGDMVEKFPRLADHQITVTLSMENSPVQAGPDSFTVRVLILGPDFREISMAKHDLNLYGALAEVREHLLETLNRHGDRRRVIERRRERRLRQAS